jgi:hypothetical protein
MAVRFAAATAASTTAAAAIHKRRGVVIGRRRVFVSEGVLLELCVGCVCCEYELLGEDPELPGVHLDGSPPRVLQQVHHPAGVLTLEKCYFVDDNLQKFTGTHISS